MQIVEKAVEMTATIDKNKQLVLDGSIPFEGPKKVKVIILMPEEEFSYDDDEIDEKEWLKAVSKNEIFDFLKDPEEDIYTIEDGKPFNA